MKEPVFVLTEQRKHPDNPAPDVIQQAVTAWLTRELSLCTNNAASDVSSESPHSSRIK